MSLTLSFTRLTQGNVTFSCSEPVFVAVTFTGPRSFLRLPGDIGLHSAGVSLGLQFRTWDTEGMLLAFDLPKRDGTVWLHLRDAKVHLQIHKAGRPPVELKAGQCGRSQVSIQSSQFAKQHLLFLPLLFACTGKSVQYKQILNTRMKWKKISKWFRCM